MSQLLDKIYNSSIHLANDSSVVTGLNSEPSESEEQKYISSLPKHTLMTSQASSPEVQAIQSIMNDHGHSKLSTDSHFIGGLQALHQLHSELQETLRPYRENFALARESGGTYHPRLNTETAAKLRDIYTRSSAVSRALHEHTGLDFFHHQIRKNITSTKVINSLEKKKFPLQHEYQDQRDQDYSLVNSANGTLGPSSPHSLNIFKGNGTGDVGNSFHSLVDLFVNGRHKPRVTSSEFKKVQLEREGKLTSGERRAAPLVFSEDVPSMSTASKEQMSSFVRGLTGRSIPEFLSSYDSPEVSDTLEQNGVPTNHRVPEHYATTEDEDAGKRIKIEGERHFVTEKSPSSLQSLKGLTRAWLHNHPEHQADLQPSVKNVRFMPSTTANEDVANKLLSHATNGQHTNIHDFLSNPDAHKEHENTYIRDWSTGDTRRILDWAKDWDTFGHSKWKKQNEPKLRERPEPIAFKPLDSTPIGSGGFQLQSPHDKDNEYVTMATSDSSHNCPFCLYGICKQCGHQAPFEQLDETTGEHKTKYRSECSRNMSRIAPEN